MRTLLFTAPILLVLVSASFAQSESGRVKQIIEVRATGMFDGVIGWTDTEGQFWFAFRVQSGDDTFYIGFKNFGRYLTELESLTPGQIIRVTGKFETIWIRTFSGPSPYLVARPLKGKRFIRPVH